MGSSPNLLDFLNDSPTISLPPVDPNVLAPVPAMAPSPQWCEKCYKQAQACITLVNYLVPVER